MAFFDPVKSVCRPESRHWQMLKWEAGGREEKKKRKKNVKPFLLTGDYDPAEIHAAQNRWPVSPLSVSVHHSHRTLAPGRNGGRQWEGENGGRSCVVLFILHRFIANDGPHANVSGVGSQWIPSAVLSTVLVMREGGA